ncbi:MAG: hypothetical protein JRH13_05775 [Deltaproteobacteria bacterium]|nr:hypothetical protein [Deltaproteobacteria bacterium]MBW2015833.1 hypothetical protein [Deltaproteobacteria bacterium]MBW2128854.1 hypothetical protein [Deltaproteobacteria bacterium]MBW2304441.1 hypothetical protein [Deltaproteobacteria bacterium]
MGRLKLSTFLQMRVNVFLYLTFGWKTAKLILFFLGKLYFFFHKKEKKRIIGAASSALLPDGSGRIPRRLAKEIFNGILSHYYEKMFIAFETPEKAAHFLNRHVQKDDLAILHRKLLAGKGVIIVTGHYGAIEYIPCLLAVNDFPVTMIARFNSRKLRDKVHAQAVHYGIKLIDVTEEGNVVKRAIGELRLNRVLITECDEIEEWRPSRKEKISFLGRMTGLDRTINVIHRRSGAEVLFGVIHRYDLNHYALRMYSYEKMAEILGHLEHRSVGETVLKFLELCILSNPDQWYQWKEYAMMAAPLSKGGTGHIPRRPGMPCEGPVPGYALP